MDKYKIFAECFPELDISEKIFYELANVENAKCIFHEKEGETIGYALIEKRALRLLCVLPEHQRKGIGTMLLRQAEDYLKSQGEKEILTGGASSKLFIGAPEKSVGFFIKYGFEIVGNCDEMKRSVQDFHIDDFSLPVPKNVSFGWYNGSIDELRKAVADVEEDWVKYYNEDSRVFCGWCDNEISSFCLINYDVDCILSNESDQIGTIGCVGTVHKHRRKGIGLKMVAMASEELKKNKCDICFIHYTGVADWYTKLGYKTFLREYFGRKEI